MWPSTNDSAWGGTELSVVQSTYQPKPQVPLAAGSLCLHDHMFLQRASSGFQVPQRLGQAWRAKPGACTVLWVRSWLLIRWMDRACGSRFSPRCSLSLLLSSLICRIKVIMVSQRTQKEHREHGREYAPERVAWSNTCATAHSAPRGSCRGEATAERWLLLSKAQGRANSCPTWSRREHTWIGIENTDIQAPRLWEPWSWKEKELPAPFLLIVEKNDIGVRLIPFWCASWVTSSQNNSWLIASTQEMLVLSFLHRVSWHPHPGRHSLIFVPNSWEDSFLLEAART